MVHSHVNRWRHKIHKCAAEIFQIVNNRMQTFCQILRTVTIDIAINSTGGAEQFALHPALEAEVMILVYSCYFK